jgi:hypothetical protein
MASGLTVFTPKSTSGLVELRHRRVAKTAVVISAL